MIAITAFDVFPENEDYLTYQKITHEWENGNHEKKSATICRMAFINLAKFDLPISRLESHIDMWYYFLKNSFENNPSAVKMLIGEYTAIGRSFEALFNFHRCAVRSLQYQIELRISVAKDYELSAAKDNAEKKGYEQGKAEEEARSQIKKSSATCLTKAFLM